MHLGPAMILVIESSPEHVEWQAPAGAGGMSDPLADAIRAAADALRARHLQACMQNTAAA